jgi:hypothetical protein
VGRKKLPRPGTVSRMVRDWPAHKPIFDYYRARMPARPKRGDREAAIAATAEYFAADERTVERAVARQAAAVKLADAAAETLSAVLRQLPHIQLDLDVAELEDFEQLDLPTLRKLRKRAATNGGKKKPTRRITRR